MKKITFGMACGLFAAFTFLVMLTLYGRNVRQEEAETALSQAIDSTLAHVMSEKNYSIKESGDLIADFLKALLVQTNSDSDITVSVLEADAKLGILSVEITEKYTHPNGEKGSVSSVRTVIFDRTAKKEKEMRTIRFHVEDEIYKEYCLPEGSMCTVPAIPQKEGARFICWRFVTGGVGKAAEIRTVGANGARRVLGSKGAPYRVSQDTKLIAVFEKK